MLQFYHKVSSMEVSNLQGSMHCFHFLWKQKKGSIVSVSYHLNVDFFQTKRSGVDLADRPRVVYGLRRLSKKSCGVC